MEKRNLSILILLVLVLLVVNCDRTFAPTDPSILYLGRINRVSQNSVTFDWSNTGFNVTVQGTTFISLLIQDGVNAFNIFLDNKLILVLNTTKSQTTYQVATNLGTGAHLLSVSRRTEAYWGLTTFNGIQTDNSGLLLAPKQISRKIEFLGDSITCGFGILGKFPCNPTTVNQDDYLTYGPIVARALSAEIHVECWSGIGLVRNYGSPNITSPDPFPVFWNRTIAATQTPIWNFNNFVPDAVVINLGTNDYSTQPQPPFSLFSQAYKDFIARIKSNYNPNVTFFLVCGPMTTVPCDTIKQVTESYSSGVYYINLQNILTSNDLGCDYHPNVLGHAKMAALSIPIIKAIMNWLKKKVPKLIFY